ncbi:MULTISPECIES: ABC transporter permease [Clostridium]|uniref:ABC-type nitrate/sulfonate/bicarbonate transport system, permease component n=1 Tax=Clostridium saccharoperbutylacetonicum N1-4(HMT) TaxID=931276 RepID=M1MIY0_9CLOT|nr:MULTISPECIES: ABC transporter permease subunit [Clostridium]AGF57889.1 ABC-type nitrate/sulfonate/bicarbonate transport system, permease component [Clostridium saccharoperbutylacetonicum N1-4(HMT)]AQR96564.1 putative aliphatic sulfonates transport permease protein SsuC [Clostridium saccharoperbutylacetonicum]NRT61338.1 NitT/TauT family transport system permease protein [Clostridium saccharoperbutylacetonicum]NSB24655.1 NitT/TauT family transport system permease protein [Clostridium saccharop
MGEKMKNILWPLSFGILIIVVWELGFIHSLLGFKPFQLPIPSQIVKTLENNFSKAIYDTAVTVAGALVGMALGCLIGFIVALIATQFPKWGYTGLTVISAFNAIPIVALSPIMNRWFTSGFAQKVGVVTVVCMAAMAINAYRGLNDLKPFAKDLLESYAASKKVIFFKLRLPNCLPSIFTALKINVAAAIMGAMISEYFASSTSGIGFGVKDNLRKGMMAMGWTYIVMASVVGIILYSIIILVERRAIKWHASQR